MPARRGRPPLLCRVYSIHITLNLREEEDDDLIAFFSVIPPRRRAAAVKAALRTGGMTATSTDATLDDDISEMADAMMFG